MFSFFLVNLFFGLLCRAGFPIIRHTLVKQETRLKKKKLSTTYYIREDIPILKKHSYSSKVQVDGESDRFREYE